MAGIQIDGVNNKIDFDDDLDTSISANTDDTLVIEAGGNTMATITATTFTINDGTTITTADNTDTLTLISTDADATQGPVLNLYRNSSAVEDDNDIARINFTGNDSGGNATTYASTRVIINDVTDGTEDTQIIHSQMIGGAFVSTLRCKPDEIVLNDSSIDLDFRVESNGNENMLFVDGGNDKVGIGINDPVQALEVRGQIGISASDTGSKYLGFYSSDTLSAFIEKNGNEITIYNEDAGNIKFATNAAEKMRINSGGVLLIGTTSTTINSSNFGVSIGNDNLIEVARNAGGTSPVLDVYGSQGEFRVMGDGDAENTNNSYTALSDERIKTNITDANSQWDDIKAIEVKNFERKDHVAKYGAGKKVQIGVVAQQVESVSPKLVKERDPTEVEINMSSEFGTLYTADDAETKDGNDAVLYVADDQEVIDGEKNVDDIKTEATHSKKVGDIKETKDQVKSVIYSVLYMKAIKALQEAQTRIETLETKVAALEG
jgi:hypothetical protein